MTPKKYLTYRRNIARQALAAAYEDWPTDKRQCITDALTDIQHLCDAQRLDFTDVMRIANDNARAERAGAQS